MKFVKLYNQSGNPIHEKDLRPIRADISFSAKDRAAYAFDGKRLIDTLEFAGIEWIEAGGIRIRGVEKDGKDRLIVQEWHVTF